MVNRVFGEWAVLAYSHSKGGRIFWLCRCSCGTTKPVSRKHLQCGASTRCRGCAHRTHGATNGRKPRTEYAIWVGIIGRCANPRNRRFKDYGGRGVAVCERWRSSFAAFLADMGPRPSPGHSIDRHPDKNGNYEPGNCRWATSVEQNRNRRDNRFITAFGKTRCVAEWAELLGIKRTLIKDRLRRGWAPERALLINGPPVGVGLFGGE